MTADCGWVIPTGVYSNSLGLLFAQQAKEACAVYVTSYLKVLGKPVKQNGNNSPRLRRETVKQPLVLLCLKIS